MRSTKFTTKIQLTNGKVAIIDADDYDLVKDYKWYLKSGRYAVTGDKGFPMHRLILGVTKPWPTVHTDHINGDGLDNRRSNLRVVTPSQNQHNSKKRVDNTSGYKGVCRSSCGNFRAYIFYKGKQISLGSAKTAEEASLLYDFGVKKYYGEYGRPNHAL